MRVIFLDVDGVLNSIRGSKTENKIEPMIDDDKVLLLKQLVMDTDAKLVLTSSWRGGWTRPLPQRSTISLGKTAEPYLLLCECLQRHGLELIAETPRLPGMGREREILYWLSCRELDCIESFVIFDDSNAEFETLRAFLVRTTMLDGLLPEHIRKAEQILSGEYSWEPCDE